MSVLYHNNLIAGTPETDLTLIDGSINPVAGGAVYDALTSGMAAKAPLASPALTGNPTAPTQAASTNNTRIATTAFVQREFGTTVAPLFSTTTNYSVGQYVVYNGLLYRCTTPHSGAWDASHFTQVTIGGELNTRTPVYGRGVNLLDNWYFVGGGSQQGGEQFPINQRGQTSYTGSGYGIDRWQFRLNSAGASAMQLSSNGIAFTKDSTYHGMVQCVATASEFSRYAGKTVTISALLVPNSAFSGRMQVNLGDATNAGAIGTSLFRGHTPVITSNIGLISGTVQLPDALQNSYFTAAIASVDGFDTEFSVMAAKLELGDHQTLAHQDASGNWVLNDPPPNYQQELAKCQRYLYVIKSAGGSNNAIRAAIGVVTSDTVAYVAVPVSMKSVPNSITTAGEWKLRDGTGMHTVTNIDLNQGPGASPFVILKVVSSSLTAGHSVFLQSQTEASIILSAEL